MPTKKRQVKDAASPAEADRDQEKPEGDKRQRLVPPMIRSKSLNLWLLPKSDGSHGDTFSEVMRELEEGESVIEKVEIGADLWNHLKPEEVGKILRSVSKLPKIRWLHISLFESSKDDGHKSLSISTLREFIANAKGLQQLLLNDIHFSGSLAEWNRLTDQIQSHPSLWHLRMENYWFQDAKVGLGDLLKGMDKLKQLEIYSLAQPQEVASLADEDIAEEKNRETIAVAEQLEVKALQCLFRSKTLQVVRFGGLSLTDKHFSVMTESLRESKALQELLLWKTLITDAGAKQFSLVLQDLPRLKKLNLNDNDAVGIVGCKAIFEALTADPGPRVEELYIGCRDMDHSCRSALLDMVAKNRSLRNLEVRFSWPADESVRTLAFFEQSMLEATEIVSPRTLQHVHLYYDGVAEQENQENTHSKEFLWGMCWQQQPVDEEED